MSTNDEQRRAAARRVRNGVRELGLRTREYVAEASRCSNLHDADIHAVGVLRAAEADGQEVTAGDLARELALSPAAASALIDRMERAGHVSRRRSPVDGRRVLLAPTDSAHSTSDEMFTPLVAAYEGVLDEYEVDELERVAEVLERLAQGTRAAAKDLGEAT